MSKLLIIIGLVLAFLIIKNLINNKPRSKTLNKTSAESEQSDIVDQSANYKKTVQCLYCGTHIPLSSAYKTEDGHYCDESHFKKTKI